MKEPVLVIMAAGMGSRYGGLKQVDPVDEDGHIIIDYSIYDAVRAGFKKVIFIIKKENEQIFRERIGDRMAGHVEVQYVYQNLDDLPEGYSVPEGRVKPWGTGHAVLSCRDVIDGPMAVINADDYYGVQAFQTVYDYLTTHEDDDQYRYMMVGYRLGNTLTENGYVSRGVCKVNAKGFLESITEHTHIEKREGGAAFTEDDGKTYTDISPEETVSMNLWGFTESFMPELKARFVDFLNEKMPENPLKSEYFLPSVVSELLAEGKATAAVLKSPDKWYGVTYKEDKPVVMAAIRKMKDDGIYPQMLWESMGEE